MTKLTKIIYILLFAILLVHPHFITGHIFTVPQAYAQSLVTLIIFGIAFIIYQLHQRDIKRKEQEKEIMERKLKISSSKLIDAFKYIGFVNRRLPLLKNLTTDLLKRHTDSKKDRKNIFYDLLAIALTSIAKADWGMLRFSDSTTGNTVKEVVHASEQHAVLKSQVSNQQLLEAGTQSNQFKEIGNLWVIPTSDQSSVIKCFLIFPKGKDDPKNEFSVLQSIVDQAQLFYKHLY